MAGALDAAARCRCACPVPPRAVRRVLAVAFVPKLEASGDSGVAALCVPCCCHTLLLYSSSSVCGDVTLDMSSGCGCFSGCFSGCGSRWTVCSTSGRTSCATSRFVASRFASCFASCFATWCSAPARFDGRACCKDRGGGGSAAGGVPDDGSDADASSGGGAIICVSRISRLAAPLPCSCPAVAGLVGTAVWWLVCGLTGERPARRRLLRSARRSA